MPRDVAQLVENLPNISKTLGSKPQQHTKQVWWCRSVTPALEDKTYILFGCCMGKAEFYLTLRIRMVMI